ncbi:patatin-like phospholipase family protein [Flavobacterium sp.]|uniref:patatin-like phospholipase family protein n=1 Tax=Flavobacterium sp. TaxID=239 RepID=UPI0039E54A3B
MDIITDLSSEAVSYLTVIQDIWRSKRVSGTVTDDQGSNLWEIFPKIKEDHEAMANFRTRISEIIWSSARVKDDAFITEFFWITANQLLEWLSDNLSTENVAAFMPDSKMGLWATPDYWRNQIKDILYKRPETRLGLVEALHYIPVQIIYALADRQPKISEQRLYQFYYFKSNPAEANKNPDLLLEKLLSKEDVKKIKEFWTDRHNTTDGKREAAKSLLSNQSELIKILNKKEITVPFLSLFEEELIEIERARELRILEFHPEDLSHFPLQIPKEKVNYDPEKKPDAMELAGLAFSGGGIRSATFNLGILQKLAELGVLPRFDYLSTVSGGGYIGSWYTSWIYRKQSVKKVIDRLDSKKSANPLAEEVRPIRWLRMFSNYLSPNSSIMSADSWTVGVIWLRNTIINQVVLLSILVTALALIGLFYKAWQGVGYHDLSPFVFRGSLFLILVGVYFASSGMSTYRHRDSALQLFLIGNKKILAHLLTAWAFLAGIVLAFHFLMQKADYSYAQRIELLQPTGFSCFVGMILIASIGGYYSMKEQKKGLKAYSFPLLAAILISSALASVAFVCLLAACWELIQYIALQNSMMVFIFGIPLVMESFCITVVVRMVIMGNFFPDERREWWGRMGAMLHRFIFWWIVITFAALWFPTIFKSFKEQVKELSPIIGGWVGLVGIAVRMAYTSGTSGVKQDGGMARAKDVFVRIAPYLFMAGFLLIGAAVLRLLEDINGFSGSAILQSAYLFLILLGVTIILSWRAGVNEFSLHDFYKNRLVRAYLGATRRRTDREQTANGFTGFDKEDDIPLVQMTGKYTGPYPLVNTTLNATTVSDLDRQDRMAESFVFTPLYCGFDINPTRSSSSMEDNVFNFGYRPTKDYSKESGPFLGTAMAISGAAVSPNMGYHSSSATSFLLTVFNVRLGRWIGNPRKSTWKNSDPGWGLGYLLKDLVGKSNMDADYVYLSDGGHFDNMGLYELIRRRCSYIVLGDGEQDENAICEGLANAIRRCRIDFGVEIDLDVAQITEKDPQTQLAQAHFVKGKIIYPNRSEPGTIIYIKTSITPINPTDIREYHLKNPKFPQQSTGDQFFDEAQFESYRKLGYNSIASRNDLLP